MIYNTTTRARYKLAKKLIKKLLSYDQIDQMFTATGGKPRLTIRLINGKELIYDGQISKLLHKFIFKKLYSKEEV